MTNTDAFNKLYETVVRLRAPDGCPWDREQSPLTLRGDLIEETYECVEAIDEGEPLHIKEELGDIFLLATMLAYMHEQEGEFSVAETLLGISEKLMRRHPHVFGTRASDWGSASAEADKAGGDGPPEGTLTSEQVLKNWARIKVEQEGRKPKDSILDEVSRGLPPLDRAWKLQKKAARAGFDWPDSAGVIAKIREEIEEVEAVIAGAISGTPAANGKDPRNSVNMSKDAPSQTASTALEEELGDLLFSVVNLCRFFKIEPSVALQRTNIKFCDRFKYVEKRMKETGREMNPENLAVMDQYWNEAKKP